jgi:hypothetical protein
VGSSSLRSIGIGCWTFGFSKSIGIEETHYRQYKLYEPLRVFAEAVKTTLGSCENVITAASQNPTLAASKSTRPTRTRMSKKIAR